MPCHKYLWALYVNGTLQYIFAEVSMSSMLDAENIAAS